MITRRKLLQILGIGTASAVAVPKVVSSILEDNTIDAAIEGSHPIDQIIWSGGLSDCVVVLESDGFVGPGDLVGVNSSGKVVSLESLDRRSKRTAIGMAMTNSNRGRVMVKLS